MFINVFIDSIDNDDDFNFENIISIVVNSELIVYFDYSNKLF